MPCRWMNGSPIAAGTRRPDRTLLAKNPLQRPDGGPVRAASWRRLRAQTPSYRDDRAAVSWICGARPPPSGVVIG